MPQLFPSYSIPGLHDYFPEGHVMGSRTEHLTTPAANPPAPPVTHGPAAGPHPAPVWLAQGNRGLSGKIKTFISTAVCLSQKEDPQMDTLEPWDERWCLLRGRGVPRKEETGQASFSL